MLSWVQKVLEGSQGMLEDLVNMVIQVLMVIMVYQVQPDPLAILR